MITRKTYTLFRDNTAVITKDGSNYSYKEILSTIDEILKNIESRSLVFCLTQNTLGSFVDILHLYKTRLFL